MSPPPELLRRSYLMYEEPFHIVGNVYFVGNTWCCSHLIDTGEGLILLDTPCLPELAYLLDGIWRLGFNPRDIKYILVSHAHMDHYGADRAAGTSDRSKNSAWRSGCRGYEEPIRSVLSE